MFLQIGEGEFFRLLKRTYQGATAQYPRHSSMIGVDCSELTGDEMLALASAISERLDGRGITIVKDDKIMVDQVSKSEITVAGVLSVVEAFVSRRRDPTHYSVEVSGDNVVVSSADPLKGGEKRAISIRPLTKLLAPILELNLHT